MNAHHASANDQSTDIIYYDFRNKCRYSAPQPAKMAAEILIEIRSSISATTGCSETVAGDVLEVLLETFGVEGAVIERVAIGAGSAPCYDLVADERP